MIAVAGGVLVSISTLGVALWAVRWWRAVQVLYIGLAITFTLLSIAGFLFFIGWLVPFALWCFVLAKHEARGDVEGGLL